MDRRYVKRHFYFFNTSFIQHNKQYTFCSSFNVYLPVEVAVFELQGTGAPDKAAVVV